MVSFPSGLLSKCRYSVMSFFVLELARKMWEQPEKSGIVWYCISHKGIFWEKLGMAVLQLSAVLSCKRGFWVSFHCIDP